MASVVYHLLAEKKVQVMQSAAATTDKAGNNVYSIKHNISQDDLVLFQSIALLPAFELLPADIVMERYYEKNEQLKQQQIESFNKTVKAVEKLDSINDSSSTNSVRYYALPASSSTGRNDTSDWRKKSAADTDSLQFDKDKVLKSIQSDWDDIVGDEGESSKAAAIATEKYVPKKSFGTTMFDNVENSAQVNFSTEEKNVAKKEKKPKKPSEPTRNVTNVYNVLDDDTW